MDEDEAKLESPSMTAPAAPLEQLLDTTDLAVALESDRFKQFLDQVPVAIAPDRIRSWRSAARSSTARCADATR